MDIIILLGMGALGGTLAGLFGVGGGVIAVPVLIILFEHQNVSHDVLVHVAVATSLATVIVTSLSSIRAHHQYGAIRWTVFRRIAPGIVVGALLGALIARFTEGDVLRYIFGVFLVLVAIQMIAGFTAKPHRQLPGRVGLFGSGLLIGSLSSLVGVGGGVMSVPFLTWCNVAMHNAVATASAIGLPIALAGVAGFITVGWNIDLRPQYSLGYVNIPAFFCFAVTSVLFAPLGARLAHGLPAEKLKSIFGVFLLILSVKILFY